MKKTKEARFPGISVKRHVVLAVALALFSGGVMAQDDESTTTAKKASDFVAEMAGSDIASNHSEVTTTDNPETDKSKMFLIYNVGTGKFLNTGGYFGHQAALSTSPQIFWLQNTAGSVTPSSSDAGNGVTTFISQNLFGNEEKFLGFAPKSDPMFLASDKTTYLTNAIGTYVDRKVTSDEDAKYCSWTLVPTNDDKNTYKLAIKLDEGEVGRGDATNIDKTYYLCADAAAVLGSASGNEGIDDRYYYYHSYDLASRETVNSIEDADNPNVPEASKDVTYLITDDVKKNSTEKFIYEYTYADNNNIIDTKTPKTYSSVKLNENENGGDDNLWKIISVEKYEDLASMHGDVDANNPFDITYLIKDQNFTKDCKQLSAWEANGFTSDNNSYAKANMLIGYDGYYKTSTVDEQYRHGMSANNYSVDDATDKGTNEIMATHSQNMSVIIKNGQAGTFYQDITISKPGYYYAQCYGETTSMSGTNLFVSVVGTEKKETDNISFNGERAKRFYPPKKAYIYWPYDYNMPMYNYAVALDYNNDFDELDLDGYTKTLRARKGIYVSIDDIAKGVKLRIGIDNTSATLGDTDWTQFDNFKLFYAAEPDLILDEDDDEMMKIDGTSYEFANTTLRLKRTFTADKWNTIFLPVGLTHEQFQTTFGEDAQLAELANLTSNRIVFETVKAPENEAEYQLKPMTPYLIKVPAEKATGNCSDTYTVSYNIVGTPQLVGISDSYYKIDGVSMDKKMWFEGNLGDDENPYNVKCWFGRKLCDQTENAYYVVKGQSVEDKANIYGTITAYGMLTRNYTEEETTDDNGQTTTTRNPLDERPSMADSYILYYDKNNDKTVMKYSKNGAASKGFRCYFKYTAPTGSSSSAKPNFLVDIDGISGDITGIDDIFTDGDGSIEKFASGVYTLDGRCVHQNSESIDKLPKGIYIVNGKKFIKQ